MLKCFALSFLPLVKTLHRLETSCLAIRPVSLIQLTCEQLFSALSLSSCLTSPINEMLDMLVKVKSVRFQLMLSNGKGLVKTSMSVHHYL
jgi:hypothetical protein